MAPAAKKASKEAVVRTPGLLLPDGILLEQCWDGKRAYFYELDTLNHPDELNLRDEFVDLAGGATLKPLVDELLTKGHITLASEPTEYGDESDLVRDIRAFIHAWVELNEIDEQLLAWYVLLTYLYDRCPAMPIINFRGAHDVGKTRGLTTVGQICYRGMRASGSLSFSSLFRNAETWRGTLLINEGDLRDSTETADIVKYLNERYERGGCVWRTDPETLQTRCFDAYGPTVMTSRREFQDPALESRCITVHMAERTRRDIPLNLPPGFYEQARAIRNKCLMFRLRHYHGFENDYTLEFEGIGSRTNQILQPLASLAKKLSPDMFALVESFAAELQDRIAEEAAGSEEGMIARAYLLLLGEATADTPAEISSADVASRVSHLGGRTTPVTVGKTLRRFGIVQRRNASGTKRVWEAPERVRKLLVRKYVPKDEREIFDTDTSDSSDSEGGGPPPDAETAVLGVIGAWGPTADEKNPVDFSYVGRRLWSHYPDWFETLKKLIWEGKVVVGPDGNLNLGG